MMENPDMHIPEECKRAPHKAGEIPASSATQFYWIDLKHKEQAREERIRNRTAETLSNAAMPKRMQEALKVKKDKDQQRMAQESQYSFQPHINKKRKTHADYMKA